MARDKKQGLDYFPLDVSFFHDERIRRLGGFFGAVGPLLYLYILCRAYNQSYYVVCDADFLDDAAIEMRVTQEKIVKVLEFIIEKELLVVVPINEGAEDSQYQRPEISVSSGQPLILTSHGIQKQYQAIMKKRKRTVCVNSKFWILKKFETEGFILLCPDADFDGIMPINPGEMAINPGEIPQSKGKKNKVNLKDKGSNISPATSSEEDGNEEDSTIPSRAAVRAFAQARGWARSKADRFYDVYQVNNWHDTRGRPVHNWKQKLICWEQYDESPRNAVDADPETSDPEKLDAMRRMYAHMNRNRGDTTPDPDASG